MKIEVGKTYRVMNDYRTRGNYNKGDILEITYIDKNEEYNRVDFLYNCTKSEFDSLEWIESMALEEVNNKQVKGANGMKIEAGKDYRATQKSLGLDVGDIVFVDKFENKWVEFYKHGELCKFSWGESVFRDSFVLQESEPSKPAHYDTAIDTIAFAKANFSREQVEGFMRINAIKYLQRIGKGEKLSDLRKAEAYIKMLIEMEEEK